MTRRFTETNKWEDKWFRKLPLSAKVLFGFLCDKCDMAGFWQVDIETASFFTGLPEKENSSLGQKAGDSCEAALEVLLKPAEEGGTPKVVANEDHSWLYVTNFLHQQGNWPVKQKNNIAPAIMRCFAERKSFGEQVWMLLEEVNGSDITNKEGAVEGASKDLPRSKGNNNNNGHGSLPEGGCKGETPPTEPLAGIVTAWNQAVPADQAVPAVTGAIQRAYAGCARHEPPITGEEIVAAVANYRQALALPDSQAGQHTLGKFLAGLGDPDRTGKYLPGTFNLRDFSKGNFRARDGPAEVHPCRGRNGQACRDPGVHQRKEGNGQVYWYCEKHEQERLEALCQ